MEATADPVLLELPKELRGYPADAPKGTSTTGASDIVVPLQLTTEQGPLNPFCTTTVFGAPLDVTLSEIAIESFFPADEETAARLRLNKR
jgi:hypothetical protein